MATRLADRLQAARQQRFVGRVAERDLFRAALTASELPFCVLHLYGPGGVGKSTLLREFGRMASECGIRSALVDARNTEPAPDSFLFALALALGLPPDENPLEALAAQSGRAVILVDTYEMLAPLDGWLRETLYPSLPEDTLVVLAGQQPPSAPWRSDSGWQELLHAIPLRNLSPDESRVYLAQRAIPAAQHRAVLSFTHGHPLALSLVAEVVAQRGGLQFQPDAAPDIVRTLLQRFVQQAPDTDHRTALEACAMVRLTTEPLLAEMLGRADVHSLFDWLRGLSFIESGPAGLFPHDLAREALTADLRWRNPDWYAELHKRARGYYLARLSKASHAEAQMVLIEYIFLHRDNPVIRPYYEWETSGTLLTDALRESDHPAVVEMVRRHEGEESARLAAHWLARQPESAVVFRESDQSAAGFMMALALEAATDADRDADPATRAAWTFLQATTPPRPGERVMHVRFWMAADLYQGVSPAQSLALIHAARLYLTTPGLAYTFLLSADPEFWSPALEYADLHRTPEADFMVGGRTYGVYGHDWRTVPPMAWLSLLAEREVAAAAPAAQPARPSALVVLSQEAFTAAVREALHDLHRPEALRANPILRSRLVVERAGAASTTSERIAALRSALTEAATALQRTPREAKFSRALDVTYFRPAPTQEQAAERLDVPFSTFRRHLTAGLAAIVQSLWNEELHGGEK
jgi:hypothetical protein